MRTILLVDDSITIQKVVERTFVETDFEVTSLGNGDEALEWLASMSPDFIIADVDMPGASGYQIADRARQMGDGIPVLLLVGTFEPFDESEAEASGASGQCFVNDCLHLSNIIGIRRFKTLRTITHNVQAHCIVRYLHSEIDAVRDAVDGVHVLWECFPAKIDPFREYRARYVLDALHQANEALLVVFSQRRETNATISHDAGCDTVQDARRESLIPGNLPIEMRVYVNEAWRRYRAIRID